MDFNVYTLGDIDFVYSAFNGIALIFSQYQGSKEFMTTAAILAGLSLFWMCYQWLLSPTKNTIPVFHWILGLMIFGGFMTRVDVTLESVKTGEMRNIDGVPIFIAGPATLSTNLFQGLLKDYKAAFDPLSPVNFSSSTLEEDMTLGPMVKLVKYMEWGGRTKEYCTQFSSITGVGNVNMCKSLESIAKYCIKAAENSSVDIPGKANFVDRLRSAPISEAWTTLGTVIQQGKVNAYTVIYGDTGQTRKTCAEAYSLLSPILQDQNATQIFQRVAQTNGMVTPANGLAEESDFSKAYNSLVSQFNQGTTTHQAMMNLFVMHELNEGFSQYRSGLQVGSDMAMFEASWGRTNQMVMQGDLWQQLAPAAISFLEMFAYMVAPFGLLIFVALGANGVVVAAKYLQLIIFVNLWPITALMVNAYVKISVSRDFDTWTTLSAENNAVSWSGMPGALEQYQSYLAVGSALYALIPVLTLFLMTQSIHPMMKATSSVTPDAKANTSHVTPEIWSGPNAGQARFGDVSVTGDISHGQGTATPFIESGLSRNGTWQAGSQVSSAVNQTASAAAMEGRTAAIAGSQAFQRSSDIGRSGSTSTSSGSDFSSAMSVMDSVASQAAAVMSKQNGLSTEENKGVVMNALLSGDLSAGASGGASIGGSGVKAAANVGGKLAASGGVSTNFQGSEALRKQVSDSIATTLQDNKQLSQQISAIDKKSEGTTFQMTSAQKEAFSEGVSQVQTATQSSQLSLNNSNAQGGGSGIATNWSVEATKLADSMQVTPSVSSVRSLAERNGLDAEKVVASYKQNFETLNSSNRLGEAANSKSALIQTVQDMWGEKSQLQPGESAAQNASEMSQMSGVFKSLTSDFGASPQFLAQMTKTIDNFTDGARGISETAGRIQGPATNLIPGEGQISAAGGTVTSQAAAQNDQRQATSTRLSGSVYEGNKDRLGSPETFNATTERNGIIETDQTRKEAYGNAPDLLSQVDNTLALPNDRSIRETGAHVDNAKSAISPVAKAVDRATGWDKQTNVGLEAPVRQASVDSGTSAPVLRFDDNRQLSTPRGTERFENAYRQAGLWQMAANNATSPEQKADYQHERDQYIGTLNKLSGGEIYSDRSFEAVASSVSGSSKNLDTLASEARSTFAKAHGVVEAVRSSRISDGLSGDELVNKLISATPTAQDTAVISSMRQDELTSSTHGNNAFTQMTILNDPKGESEFKTMQNPSSSRGIEGLIASAGLNKAFANKSGELGNTTSAETANANATRLDDQVRSYLSSNPSYGPEAVKAYDKWIEPGGERDQQVLGTNSAKDEANRFMKTLR